VFGNVPEQVGGGQRLGGFGETAAEPPRLKCDETVHCEDDSRPDVVPSESQAKSAHGKQDDRRPQEGEKPVGKCWPGYAAILGGKWYRSRSTERLRPHSLTDAAQGLPDGPNTASPPSLPIHQP
jgi:hypothetical protein